MVRYYWGALPLTSALLVWRLHLRFAWSPVSRNCWWIVMGTFSIISQILASVVHTAYIVHMCSTNVVQTPYTFHNYMTNVVQTSYTNSQTLYNFVKHLQTVYKLDVYKRGMSYSYRSSMSTAQRLIVTKATCPILQKALVRSHNSRMADSFTNSISKFNEMSMFWNGVGNNLALVQLCLIHK